MSIQFKVLHPYSYYKGLTEGVINGTKLPKEIQLAHVTADLNIINSAQGSAIVEIRETRVISAVKVKVCRPTAENPSDGFLIPNVDLPRLCSTKFRSFPPGDEAQRLSHFILDALIASGCINLSDLVIEPGRLVYAIYIDVTCLCYDGCIEDACFIAVAAALCSAIVPCVKFDKELDRAYVLHDSSFLLSSKIDIGKLPLAVTFVVLGPNQIIPNGTLEQEDLAEGKMVIVCRDDGVQHFNPGFSLMALDSVSPILNKASEVCSLLRQKLRDMLILGKLV